MLIWLRIALAVVFAAALLMLVVSVWKRRRAWCAAAVAAVVAAGVGLGGLFWPAAAPGPEIEVIAVTPSQALPRPREGDDYVTSAACRDLPSRSACVVAPHLSPNDDAGRHC